MKASVVIVLRAVFDNWIFIFMATNCRAIVTALLRFSPLYVTREGVSENVPKERAGD